MLFVMQTLCFVLQTEGLLEYPVRGVPKAGRKKVLAVSTPGGQDLGAGGGQLDLARS